MFAEFGLIFLIIAFGFSLIQTVSGVGYAVSTQAAARIGRGFYAATYIVAFALLVSFGCLVAAFVVSDFSVALVAQHSHSSKPLLYKITGSWGNHEGSMLLFVLIHAVFAAAFAYFSRHGGQGFNARVLAVCGGLTLLFVGFILLTSSPFWRLFPSPFTGLGLNPVLQDVGLAIHPPTLYVGYVGLSIPFAMAVAGLWEGRIDGNWARATLPWASFAWAFLTLGIMLGSIWAYYELGWGGWWAWDPVENVSFMPWLAAVALIHSLRVVARHGGLAAWSVLLAIFSFALSLIGTFVVRSGVLLSVHAFAVDPARGAYILCILAVVVGGALGLYGRRAHLLFKPDTFGGYTREAALLFNNFMIILMLLIVALGTFYPLILDAITGDTVTVGPPYFNMFFVPLGLILVVAMGIAPYLGWQNTATPVNTRPMLLSMGIAIIAGFVSLVLTGSLVGSIGFACAFLLASLSLIKPFETGLNRKNFMRLTRQPAVVLAHFGMAVFVFGVTALGLGTTDKTMRLSIGETASLSGYTVRLDNVTGGDGPNYAFQRGILTVSKGDWQTVLSPELRYFPAADEVTREADLYVVPNVTVFSVMGEGDMERGWQIRLYIHPFVSWIWAGIVLMALGGFASVLQNTRGPNRRAA